MTASRRSALDRVARCILAVRRPHPVRVAIDGPDAAGCWDLRVFVDVDPEEALRRAVRRDVALLGSERAVHERYRRRYLPAQALYRARVRPSS